MYILKRKGKTLISVWLPWKPRVAPLRKEKPSWLILLNFLCFGLSLYISFSPHILRASDIHNCTPDLVQLGNPSWKMRYLHGESKKTCKKHLMAMNGVSFIWRGLLQSCIHPGIHGIPSHSKGSKEYIYTYIYTKSVGFNFRFKTFMLNKHFKSMNFFKRLLKEFPHHSAFGKTSFSLYNSSNNNSLHLVTLLLGVKYH